MESKVQPTSSQTSSSFGAPMDAIDLVPLASSAVAERKISTSPSRVSNTLEHQM
jgi:hypothetical protein